MRRENPYLEGWDADLRQSGTTDGIAQWRARNPLCLRRRLAGSRQRHFALRETVRYTYIAELGNVVSSLTAGDVTQTFDYDTTTGALLQAEEGDVRNTNTWTPSGLLQAKRSRGRVAPVRRSMLTR
jgi:hypothetical protein